MANFNLNRVIIGGRLTADPELKQTQNQIPVASFSIATSRKTKDSSGQTTADYFNCTAWRGMVVWRTGRGSIYICGEILGKGGNNRILNAEISSDFKSDLSMINRYDFQSHLLAFDMRELRALSCQQTHFHLGNPPHANKFHLLRLNNRVPYSMCRKFPYRDSQGVISNDNLTPARISNLTSCPHILKVSSAPNK